MLEFNLDYEVVAVGLNWEQNKVVEIALGARIPTEKDREAVDNYIKENGFEVIKARKINGQFVTKCEELSKILEDYYTNKDK